MTQIADRIPLKITNAGNNGNGNVGNNGNGGFPLDGVSSGGLEIIGKVRFNPQTKITNGNFVNGDYSQNSEYITMLEDGNFIEVTQEQYDFISEHNNNGFEVCIINDELVKCEEDPSITLTKLKKARADKFNEMATAYYQNAEICLINVTFNGRTEYLELTNKEAGLRGMRQALQKIKDDVVFSATVDPMLPQKYQGIEKMYYIYVTEFTRLGKMDSIIMKQSKKQALINFWEDAIQKYEGTYQNGEKEVYVDFFYENYVPNNPSLTKLGFYEYKKQLDILTTIQEVQNFSFEFTPLTLVFPEDCIVDVIYNDDLYDFS